MEEQNNHAPEVEPQVQAESPVRKVFRVIFGSAIWACIVSFILITIGQLLGGLGFFALRMDESALGYTAGVYLMFLAIWVLFLLNALLKSNRPLLKAYGTGLSGNRIPQLLIGLLIGLGMNGLLILFAGLHGDIHIYVDKIEILPILLLLFSVFVQSSAEEVACRGFLYFRVLRTYRGKYIAAIAVNSIFFAANHLGNNSVTALAVVDLIVTGVLFSLMVYYFDSLWMAFGVHTGWNFMQSILIGLPNSGNVFPYSVCKLDAATARSSFFYDVGFGVEGTIPAVIIQVVVIVAVVVIGRKRNVKRTEIWE